MLIHEVVAALVDPLKPSPPLMQQELLIRLGIWMQYSTQPQEAEFGLFAAIVRYIKDQPDYPDVSAEDRGFAVKSAG